MGFVMKFVFNFIVFGIIFYLMGRYMPGTIETMTGWADQGFEAVHNMVSQLLESSSKSS